jgi:hypothetical protein
MGDAERPDAPEMTVAQLKTHVDRRFAAFEKNLKTLLRQERAAMRRHFDVVAERLRADLNLFAEGCQANHGRLEDHELRIRTLEKRPP